MKGHWILIEDIDKANENLIGKLLIFFNSSRKINLTQYIDEEVLINENSIIFITDSSERSNLIESHCLMVHMHL